MAERRMFAKTIIDSDAFLDMPLSSHALYFHLSMRADDDGFINNPKKIQRMIGASDDDLKLLIAKNFIIPFESGIVVIKHWRIHNYIRNDRYKSTVYEEERSMLDTKENNAYTLRPANGMPLGIPDGNQSGYQMETQVRIGKDSIGKDNNIGEKSTDPIDRKGKIPPKVEETKQDGKQEEKAIQLSKPQLKKLFSEYTSDEAIKNLLLEWCEIRKAKKGVNTETAIRANLKKLQDMANQSSLTIENYLEEVISRSWLAFYPIRSSANGNSGKFGSAAQSYQFPPLQIPMRVFDSSKDDL